MIAWLKRVLGLTPHEWRPRPPEWNKTLADLSAENRSLSGEEIEWARDYEREQLRSWARFPKDGEVFAARCDVAVKYTVYWRAPYSTGGEGVLPTSTQVRVSVPAGDAEPVGVYVTPVDEKNMEAQLVSEDDRLSAKYDGYSVFLSVSQLNTDFQLLVQENPDEMPGASGS